ncbi:dipeptide/oligopeptide/nickel ABC transporter permease/ATP-binding protein [Subtercola frigoramans]|uniref:Peptide/nickel transport system permease protein n=1 Tax=Subtercola frigoramans TaxID=120298 RepID=A0ABS2L9I8_9MICO|nr:dipeptide/oligopeptide/nickel ABC transporter permease/ATP-binding protein [Subtercola frigoramans]MBM7473679.1 peptide/nickel transport system permease protein [Subtercola frigoramans]
MTVPTAAVPAAPSASRLKLPHGGRAVLAACAVLWLAIVILACSLAGWLAPHDAYRQDLTEVFAGPSANNLLGTDSVGRDVLSRLMFGGTTSLIGVASAVIIFLLVGVVGGLIAGYFGNIADRSVSAVNMIIHSTPSFIVLFVVLSVFRDNTYIAMAVFGFVASPTMFFLIRGATLAVRNELFIDAAKVSGLAPFYIIFQHILPRVRGLIIVQAAVFAALALVIESALSFLGFGAQPPEPTWGGMVSEAARQITLNPFVLYAAGGVIALTSFSLGILGDTLRDRMASNWAVTKLTRDPRKPRPETVQKVPTGALLSVTNLSVGYRSGAEIVPIVKDVSFTIGKGEIVGLVGESGSGKTTVAFGVLGVIGEGVAITDGAVVFAGTDLVGLSGRQLAEFRGRRVAYVAQEPMVALDPNYRIAAQLGEVIRRNDGLTGAAIKTRMLELLRQVELPDPEAVSRKYAHELSGGMAQRVSIAMALAGRPELLVADEPTTALDVTVQAGILGLLIRLRDEIGMSVLIITHDWGVVADVCDRVVVMYKGEIVEQADAETIFANPSHPYTRALLVSNPHGAEPGVDLPVVTGVFSTPSQGRENELEEARA